MTDEPTLSEIADKVRTHLHRGACEYLEAGRWLTVAKSRCPYGTWGEWLKREFRFGERMAEQLMNAHARFGSDPQRVADLSLRTLFLLSAPSVPEYAVDEILGQATIAANLSSAAVRMSSARSTRTAMGSCGSPMQARMSSADTDT